LKKASSRVSAIFSMEAVLGGWTEVKGSLGVQAGDWYVLFRFACDLDNITSLTWFRLNSSLSLLETLLSTLSSLSHIHHIPQTR
jgi:hypothetical protein